MNPPNRRAKTQAETPRNRLAYVNIRLLELQDEKARLIEERALLRVKVQSEKGVDPAARRARRAAAAAGGTSGA